VCRHPPLSGTRPHLWGSLKGSTQPSEELPERFSRPTQAMTLAKIKPEHDPNLDIQPEVFGGRPSSCDRKDIEAFSPRWDEKTTKTSQTF